MEANQAYKAAKSGALWLAKCVLPSGKFIYGYNAMTMQRIKGYNILRHAGSVWAMLDVVLEMQQVGNFTNVLDKARSEYDYLLNQSIKALHYIVDRAITYFRDEIVIYEKNHVKVGGMGLAVLALFRYSHVVGNQVDLPKMICDTLVEYVKSDGSMVHKFNARTGELTSFVSDFYPGEVALALMQGYFLTGRAIYREKAQAVVRHQYALRQVNGHVRDHWIMQAINKLDRDYHLDYANKIVDRTINDPTRWKSGAIGCRAESLLAYLDYVTRNGWDVGNKFDVALNARMFLNRTCEMQIKEGLSEGAFRKSDKSWEVRIDYTQHNISALMKFYRLSKQGVI